MSINNSSIIPSGFYKKYDFTVKSDDILKKISPISFAEILNKPTLTAIENTWSKYTLIDVTDGTIWVKADQIHSVLRTSKAIADKWKGRLEDKYRMEVNECINGENIVIEYVDSVAIVVYLHKAIPNSQEFQRVYREYSWALLTTLRDSPELKQLNSLYNKNFAKELKKLKHHRIDEYKLKIDELTLELLQMKDSEFSHIRSKVLEPKLALFTWNGLVVNKSTHTIITTKNILDENDLKNLCIEQEWDTSWYENFRYNLGKYNSTDINHLLGNA